MASRAIFRTLMAGAAIMSLSTAATAGGWDSYIVFGDRNHDSGQYVSHEAVFADADDEIGDGRNRATNIISSGGRGQVISQIVANNLGFGPVSPSQPQSIDGIPTPEDGYNYASSFYRSTDVLASINDTAHTGRINFLGPNSREVSLNGRERPGLLSDPERSDRVRGALILINGGTRDLRDTANIERDLDQSIDLGNTKIEIDANARFRTARDAADNIVTGVRALSEAGAGLVVVTNAYDVGAIPEVNGDNELLSDVDTLLLVREEEAEAAEFRMDRAIETFRVSAGIADSADASRARIEQELVTAQSAATPNTILIANLTGQLQTASSIASSTRATADANLLLANDATDNAARLALTNKEIALREQVDAAIADPDLIATIRTAATDTYNARLAERLRGIDGNIIVVDQNALFEKIIAEPSLFGFDDTVDQANVCLSSNTLHPCDRESGRISERLFIDGIDFTEAGHKIAADMITALIKAPAAISGAPSVGLSSGRSVSDAARDQLSREQSWKTGVSVFGTGVTSRIKLSDTDGFPQNDAAFHSGVVGAKYVFGNGLAFGAAGSYQLIKTPGGQSALKFGGDAVLGSIFAGLNSGPIFGSVTATYGRINYDELTRVSQLGPARILNKGETKGTVKGITGEAGVRLVQYDVLRAGPIANFSHWTSEIDGYAESGWQATAVRTGDLETKSTRVGFGVFMEAGGIVDGYGSLFRAKALYGHEFQDDTKTASVTPTGTASAGSFTTSVRGTDSAPFELGGEVVFGYGGVITTFGYDGTFGDISDHRFRLGASIPLGG